MEITEIKARLPLKDVLSHYHLKPDKHLRLHCPFHPDKTPSLQIYYKTQSCYCFSSNCPTNGKALDVIDFILYKEQCSKHEAILKAKALINGQAPTAEHLSRVAVLTKMFTYFKNAVHNSKPAQDYLQQRSIDHTQLEIGYNSGQFHHGQRKNEALIESCVKVGLLLDKGQASRTGGKAYVPFGKGGIAFPLRNAQNQIVSLYFRSTTDDKDKRHYYLKDRQGLYPRYPAPETGSPAAERLIITESIIDAASLLQQEAINKEYSILALYGTNGLTEEHRTALQRLTHLQEVILFLNGDDAGKVATAKYAHSIKTLLPNVKVTRITPPEGEDVNSLLQSHEPEILTHLLDQRTDFLFSSEDAQPQPAPQGQETIVAQSPPASPKPSDQPPTQPLSTASELNAENPNNLCYRGQAAYYYLKGGIKGSLDSLKVSVQMMHRTTRQDYRAKLDLYEYKQTEAISKAAAERLALSPEAIQEDLTRLAHLLEQYREETLRQQGNPKQKPVVTIPPATMNECLSILQSEQPMQQLNELIGKAGVVGEENNRLFLLAIASSYKMPDTLHALIQGSSGSGKTRLLKTICSLMPGEDTIKFTRVTDSSFYNYPEDYLSNKLLGFEDLDGLKEEALYAVRELISNEILVSSTTTKTEQGEIMAMEKTVRGPIASISCTTKGAIYEDNMSRVFLIAVDESSEQTKRIITYQQQQATGQVSPEEEGQARELLQHCIRLLKPYPVVNPFADKLQLPAEAHKIRRLNDLYLSFVRQVTLLNQYRRKKDGQGRLITQTEDLQIANRIMFDSIVLKVDELDGSLRSFYERLKQYVQEKTKSSNGDQDYAFSQRDIRQALRMSKTGCQNYLNSLLELEYIRKSYTGQRNTYHYQVSYWDSLQALRERIQAHLHQQLDMITDQS